MHLSLKGSLDRQPLTDRLGDRLLAEYGGAAAAYSLRALNGNGESVVRVRRASDNSEQDFTALQVSSGEMVNWVNAQIVPPLDIRELDANGERTGALVGAAAAYSLRNLSASYTGNVVDVRRSSDDAVASFTADEVSDGTLVAWVGAGNDGTVSKWYDQSGNDNHAVQTTPANQPTIVEGGSLVTNDEGNPSIQNEEGTYFDLESTVGGIQDLSVFFAGEVPTNFAALLGLSANSSSMIRFSKNYWELVANNLDLGNMDWASALTEGDTSIFNFTRSSGVVQGFVNSTNSSATTSPNTNNFVFNTIFRRVSASYNDYIGKASELIIYASDQTDNRTAIEANIGETYGIDLPSGVDTGYDEVDGFVETWYDQSGNGNDATQATIASQPKIVDAGSLVTGGLNFDNSDDFLSADSLASDFSGINIPASSFLVMEVTGVGNSASYSLGNLASGTQFQEPIFSDGVFYEYFYRDDASSLKSRVNISAHSGVDLASSISSGTNLNIFINGSNIVTNEDITLGQTTLDRFTIGCLGRNNVSNFFGGTIAELIVYASDESSNRTAIEDNINDHYNIY